MQSSPTDRLKIILHSNKKSDSVCHLLALLLQPFDAISVERSHPPETCINLASKSRRSRKNVPETWLQPSTLMRHQPRKS
jgi:hypothetical protein